MSLKIKILGVCLRRMPASLRERLAEKQIQNINAFNIAAQYSHSEGIPVLAQEDTSDTCRTRIFKPLHIPPTPVVQAALEKDGWHFKGKLKSTSTPPRGIMGYENIISPNGDRVEKGDKSYDKAIKAVYSLG